MMQNSRNTQDLEAIFNDDIQCGVELKTEVVLLRMSKKRTLDPAHPATAGVCWVYNHTTNTHVPCSEALI